MTQAVKEERSSNIVTICIETRVGSYKHLLKALLFVSKSFE